MQVLVMELKELTARARNPETTAAQLMDLAGRADSVDRLLAKHASAPAELLEQLSHSNDRATRKAVAVHPSASKAVLLRLAPQFPGDFFKNPAFDWLLLEDPNLMFEIGGGVLKNVLKRADCPASFMTWAAAHGSEQEQLAVAMNSEASPEILSCLKKSVSIAVRDASVARTLDDMSANQAELALVDAVVERIGSVFPDEREIGLPHWPFLAISALAGFEGKPLRVSKYSVWDNLKGSKFASPPLLGLLRLALSPYAPFAMLEKLASDPNEVIRAAVARNPVACGTLLEKLATDSDLSVRISVATNPKCPDSILEALSNEDPLDRHLELVFADGEWCYLWDMNLRGVLNGKPWIASGGALCSSNNLQNRSSVVDKLQACYLSTRAAVSANPNVPIGLLVTLTGDANAEVRAASASNSRLPRDFLKVLSRDLHPLVSFGIALNPTAPQDILDALGLSSLEFVQSRVAANPNTSLETIKYLINSFGAKSEAVRAGLAENPFVPDYFLQELVTDQDVWIRRGVAFNSNPSLEARKVLGTETNGWVQEALLRNMGTSPEVLSLLARDARVALRLSIANHPNAPEKLQRSLERFFQLKAKSPFIRHRKYAAGNRGAPATVLEMLAKEPAYGVLAEVAANVTATSEIRAEAIDRLLQGDRRSEASFMRRMETASGVEMSALERSDVLYFSGSNPNASLLSKRPLARLLALFSGPYLEPSRIARAASSPDWLLRAAVARNRATPVATAQILLRDPHPVVRALMKSTLSRERPTSYLAIDRARVLSEISLRFDREQDVHAKDSIHLRISDPLWGRTVDFESVCRTYLGISLLCLFGTHKKLIDVNNDFEAFDPFKVLLDIVGDGDSYICYRVASNPLVPGALLDILVSHQDSFVRQSLAKNPQTSSAALHILSSDPDEGVRREVAGNRNTPVSSLSVLTDDTFGVRERLAGNPNSPKEVLDCLGAMTPRNPLELAGNPNSPTDLIVALCNESIAFSLNNPTRNYAVESLVALAVAQNPSAPVALLEILMNHVPYCVAENRSMPVHLLEIHASSSNWQIREGVAKNLNATSRILEGLAWDNDEKVRKAVALNPRTSPGVLYELANDRRKYMDFRDGSRVFAEVRYAVLLNPSATDGLREFLFRKLEAEKKEWAPRFRGVSCIAEIKHKLLKTARVPSAIIDRLASDPNPVLYSGLVKANLLPAAVLRQQVSWLVNAYHAHVSSQPNTWEPEDITDSDFTRAIVILGLLPRDVDNGVLTRASRSPDWLVRFGAALHHDSSRSNLEFLAEDSDPDVAAAARGRLDGFRQLAMGPV